MSAPGPAIQALPLDVAAQIKSSTSITHLHGVVVDLVKNSLDAGAQTVLVSVDFKRGSCTVEDDGEGIRPAEFEPTGGLGKAHRTSSSTFDYLALLNACLRYVQVPNSRSLWARRSIPGFFGLIIAAHCDVSSYPTCEHKCRHLSPCQARSTIDPCSGPSGSPAWRTWDMCFRE